MKITASRLSEGNKVFPSEIHLEPTGLTVKIPGLFSGKTEYFDFKQISNVSVNAPMIGYSTITFHAAGAKVSAHGFTSKEVKQIKEAIENGKSNSSNTDNNNSNSGGGSTTIINKSPSFMSVLAGKLDPGKQLEKQREEKQEEKIRVEGKIDDVATMTFGSTAEDISNRLSHLVTIGNSKPDKNLKSAIVEKMEFGIMKLKSLGAIAEADFFEKKLEPLKKKSWF